MQEVNNCNVRIANLNLLENYGTYTYPIITLTSEDGTNVLENALDQKRQTYLSFTGHFEITTANQNIFFNDGIDRFAPVPVGSYTTGSALATAMQTALNAVTSNWTVTYSSGRFTIANTSSVTMRFSARPTDIWDTTGFTSETNASGTSFTSDEIRNHTTERILVDFGGAVDLGFVGIIGPSTEEFSFSDNSNIKIYGNNINSFSTAILLDTLSVDDDGAFSVLDSVDSYYRYFWLEFDDKRKPDYSPKISNLFMGEFISSDFNIVQGFNLGKVDRSLRTETESGILFHDIKSRYWEYEINYAIISKSDLTKFLNLWDESTITKPFYVAIDHKLNFTESRRQNIKYVYFNEAPKFKHVFYDKYSLQMSFREAL